MRLQPLFDRIILRRLANETTTSGGVVIPANTKDEAVTAEVVAVGLGKILDNGDCRVPEVSLGDHVLLESDECIEFELDGSPLLAAREEDVICIIKN